MSTKKVDLLELSDSERMKIIKEAKASLLRQVEEARLYQSFAQISDCKC
jgi:hypothetical protein